MKLANYVVLVPLLIVGACGEGWMDAKILTQAQFAVKDKLVSPGSADFDKSLIAARTADRKQTLVYISVDSQNRMGGLVRSYGLAVVRKDSDGEPKVVRCDVYTESPTKGVASRLAMNEGEPWQWEDWMK